MRIRMLETRRGTEDGFTILRFEKDVEYDVGDMLAHAFLTTGFAVEINGIPASSAIRPKRRRRRSRSQRAHPEGAAHT